MNRNKTYPALDVSALTVRLAWANLEIAVDDVKDIQVLVSGSDEAVSEMKIQHTSGMLLLEQPAYGLSVKLTAGRWMSVLVRIPRDWKGAVDATTLSGLLNARGVTASDLALATASGDMKLMNLHSLTTAISTLSGCVSAALLVCDQLSLRTVSGKAHLEDSQVMSAKMQSVSGDLHLSLTAPPERLEAATVSASLFVDAPITAVQARHTSVGGKLRTWNVSVENEGIPIALSTVSGDLEITGADE